MSRLLAALSILFLSLAACSDVTTRISDNGRAEADAGSGTFRGRWWHYFERGVASLEEDAFQNAVGDFQAAIGARAEDSWRARTYGMHFIDYFPHRELGIVHYRMGRYDSAIAELEHSIATAPSAKASYFLNLARQAQLRRTGLDQSAPVITVTAPREGVITNAFILTIDGTAEDDTFVAEIDINGNPYPLELSSGRVDFSQEIGLVEGDHELSLSARDLLGKLVVKKIALRVDRRGPLISVDVGEDMRGEKGFRVVVHDEAGIDRLTVDGEERAPAVPENRMELSFVPGRRPMVIEARDRAGNWTRAEIERDALSRLGARLPILAQAGWQDRAGGGGGSIVVAADGAAKSILSGVGSLFDSKPPRIVFKKESLIAETFEDRFLIEGRAEDGLRIRSLSVNDEEIVGDPGRVVYFSVLEKLEEGENIFTIRARDYWGNEAVETLRVARKIHKVRQIGSRMTIALLPLEQKGKGSGLGEIAHDRLIAAFVDQGRFQIVERQKLESLLREMKLGAADLADKDHAVRLGKMIAADSLLAGTVMDSEKGIEIVSRLIDTESGVIMTANDVFGETRNAESLGSLLDALAFKFKRDFPLLEGIILDRRKEAVHVDIGKRHGLKNLVRLICFRETDDVIHPMSGKVLGKNHEELAHAKVTRVHEEYSQAELIGPAEGVQARDLVITR